MAGDTKGKLSTAFSLKNVNLEFEDFPLDLQDHILDNLGEAITLASRNEAMIAQVYDRLANHLETLGRNDLKDLLLQRKCTHEAITATRFSETTEWRSAAQKLEDHAQYDPAVEFSYFKALFIQHGLNFDDAVEAAGLNLEEIEKTIRDNNEKIQDAVETAAHPELPEVGKGRFITLPPDTRQFAEAALQLRIVSSCYDSYFHSLQGIKHVLAKMKHLAELPENANPLLSADLAALETDFLGLFNRYGERKDFAYEPSNGTDGLDATNDALHKDFEDHLRLLSRMDKIIDEYPQLAIYPYLRSDIESFREKTTELKEDIELNSIYLDALKGLDRADLDPSPPSPTDTAASRFT